MANILMLSVLTFQCCHDNICMLGATIIGLYYNGMHGQKLFSLFGCQLKRTSCWIGCVLKGYIITYLHEKYVLNEYGLKYLHDN